MLKLDCEQEPKFEDTVETILIEVKRQLLNGAQRIILERDGEAIFCEPQY